MTGLTGFRNQSEWDVPGGMPVLSRGRHRRPRQGACFMEFASYLAGEPWSDHPACTHPLLAFLARGVNDFTSDSARQALARHIPSVVGLTGASPLIDPAITLRAAVTPLASVAETRQRALAVGVLSCRSALEDAGQETPRSAELLKQAERVAPLAMAWARDFTASVPTFRRPVSFSRRGRAIISTAVLGAAEACVSDPDALLRSMLLGAIADTEELVREEIVRGEEQRMQDPVDSEVRAAASIR
ncbi:hypothetical protein OH146_02815 [Salinibacterium sp. SYSU T00001]|uniref:hypothetical protein n=1 Tax=Homoserinimonas sedimenticola TaxID=2986805 RepID=UPI002235F662|nr:hypothetical protein [Salinibacterium sedimenticola]MCW4384700.1 hypothetical protein [Salinibacterium sedimenticola]